jgi:hypothetical protein
MKTAIGEISILTLEEVKLRVKESKPHFFKMFNTETCLMNLFNPEKVTHSGCWVLGARRVLTFTNLPENSIPESLVHELVELSIFNTIGNVFPSFASFLKAIPNVTHFLAADSLNQYDMVDETVSPISTYLPSDREPAIGIPKPTLKLNRGEKVEL